MAPKRRLPQGSWAGADGRAAVDLQRAHKVSMSPSSLSAACTFAPRALTPPPRPRAEGPSPALGRAPFVLVRRAPGWHERSDQRLTSAHLYNTLLFRSSPAFWLSTSTLLPTSLDVALASPACLPQTPHSANKFRPPAAKPPTPAALARSASSLSSRRPLAFLYCSTVGDALTPILA